MSSLSPGDRAIVIRSSCGNEGKIVQVLRYFNGEILNGRITTYPADLVVRSLGEPFFIGDENGNFFPQKEAPVHSSCLRKLPVVTDNDLELVVVR